ncbi:MAG: aminotransferase class IV [Bacteroidetes bacterium]|nr:aminotransferase class IV [Bacteroidota bacterium]
MNTQTTTLFRHAVRDLSVIPLKDAVLPVSVREVFFNFSVYESIKIIEGIPVFLRDHLERLLESANRLEINHSFSPEDISRMLFLLIMTDSVTTATFRVQLIGGQIPMLFIFPQDLPVYPDNYYTEGVSVITYVGERIIPEVKSNSLLLNYLAQREAEKKQALEALFIDRNGCAVEGTRSNFFAVSGNRLITPGKGILAGVTRKYILKSAEMMGMEIIFKDPALEEILKLQYDELFLSSTSMGAMPISRIDDVLLPNQFDKSRELHRHVRKLEKKYVSETKRIRG